MKRVAVRVQIFQWPTAVPFYIKCPLWISIKIIGLSGLWPLLVIANPGTGSPGPLPFGGTSYMIFLKSRFQLFFQYYDVNALRIKKLKTTKIRAKFTQCQIQILMSCPHTDCRSRSGSFLFDNLCSGRLAAYSSYKFLGYILLLFLPTRNAMELF